LLGNNKFESVEDLLGKCDEIFDKISQNVNIQQGGKIIGAFKPLLNNYNTSYMYDVDVETGKIEEDNNVKNNIKILYEMIYDPLTKKYTINEDKFTKYDIINDKYIHNNKTNTLNGNFNVDDIYDPLMSIANDLLDKNGIDNINMFYLFIIFFTICQISPKNGLFSENAHEKVYKYYLMESNNDIKTKFNEYTDVEKTKLKTNLKKLQDLLNEQLKHKSNRQYTNLSKNMWADISKTLNEQIILKFNPPSKSFGQLLNTQVFVPQPEIIQLVPGFGFRMDGGSLLNNYKSLHNNMNGGAGGLNVKF